MQKLLLLSVVLAAIGFPVLAAHDRSALRSLKKTLMMVVVFNVFYLFAMFYL